MLVSSINVARGEARLAAEGDHHWLLGAQCMCAATDHQQIRDWSSCVRWSLVQIALRIGASTGHQPDRQSASEQQGTEHV
jgi:hypothetical protein